MTNKDKIIAEKDGSFTVNVNAGSVTSSPPHIVDSGASVMNNEPVAWMVQYKGKHDFTFYKPVSHDDAVVVPLYTHPAKTLTDEEITAISRELFKDYRDYRKYQIEFARKILRKAQEK